MGKFKLLLVFFLCYGVAHTQEKVEREHRIRKVQFPALDQEVTLVVPNIKKVRYYKEIDSSGNTYILRFKKERLHYHIDYDKNGNLQNSGFKIKRIDIPEEYYDGMERYMVENFGQFKIRTIWQEYPIIQNSPMQDPLKNTFQNLILPNINYKFLIRSLSQDKTGHIEVWFDSEGKYLKMRAVLPTNFDHVLY
ncbi:MAG: hypothetical protein E4H26_00675 [Flavobacteriales bacterium]|nr:MAG: hypothetical protein E4H26_00675 [Flavobacteriales bacterium]